MKLVIYFWQDLSIDFYQVICTVIVYQGHDWKHFFIEIVILILFMLNPILHLRDGIILHWKAYNLQPITFLQGNIVQINLKLDKKTIFRIFLCWWDILENGCFIHTCDLHSLQSCWEDLQSSMIVIHIVIEYLMCERDRVHFMINWDWPKLWSCLSCRWRSSTRWCQSNPFFSIEFWILQG